MYHIYEAVASIHRRIEFMRDGHYRYDVKRDSGNTRELSIYRIKSFAQKKLKTNDKNLIPINKKTSFNFIFIYCALYRRHWPLIFMQNNN